METRKTTQKYTIRIYRSHKDTIQNKHVYFNRTSPGIYHIWIRAKTNTPQFNDRNRHSNKETNCLNCGKQSIETIGHFILDCTVILAYNNERQQLIEIQQPYNKNEDKIIGQFLFSKVNLEKRKELSLVSNVEEERTSIEDREKTIEFIERRENVNKKH